MENKRRNEMSDQWLVEATIDDLQDKLSQGLVTSKDLILLYLDRIKRYNPIVNAILEVNPEALQLAMALDVERKAKGPRGPLHGIPIIIKDNIDTKDKMHTSAGSLALANSYAKKDAEIVRRLRKSGAILLGKANMTEWANFMADNMPSGYSSRGGQVQNPYGPNKFTVGGSSSGTGAGIAMNFATVGIGTETSGSILNPSCQNSLVGVKPTVGLVSRSGIIPLSHTQDTAGPMTRTVKDAAILLNSIAGRDENDPMTLTNPFENTDFTQFLTKEGISNLRIGLCRTGFYKQLDDREKGLYNDGINVLKRLGVQIEDNVEIPSVNEKWSYKVLLYEFKADLNAYLGQLDSSYPIRSLKDVIDFNLLHKEKCLKYFQEILLEAEATSGTLTEPEYLEALEHDHYYSREAGIDQVLEEKNLDLLVFPHDYGCGIPARAGYPSVTVPAGFTEEGRPFGITFTGSAYSEPVLLKIAYAYEQATKHRVPPKLILNLK